MLQHVQKVILQMKRQNVVFNVRKINTAKIVDIDVTAQEMNGKNMQELMKLQTKYINNVIPLDHVTGL